VEGKNQSSLVSDPIDFQDLESQAEEGITLLQERRTALISAAVTGKIDVRNWLAAKPTNTQNDVAV